MSENTQQTFAMNFSKKFGKSSKKTNKKFQEFDVRQLLTNKKTKEAEVKVYESNYIPKKQTKEEESKNSEKIQSNFQFEKPSSRMRNASRDSGNYSTSSENNSTDLNASFNQPLNLANMYNYQNSQFKSTANDFKVKYKTELCKFFEMNGFCKFGDKCAYAHGKEELRSKVTKSSAYRSRKCTQFFEKGFCPYGSRCQFAHALSTNILNNPYEKNMSYTKTLKTLSKLENVQNIKSFAEKRRLPIFQQIVPSTEKESNENCFLFEEIKKLTASDIYERLS
ncbi:MAG: zinc finger CCCH domain-containing protein [archaeon]|nr:zinc finger CCCH domain-containing protein [archaeon]